MMPVVKDDDKTLSVAEWLARAHPMDLSVQVDAMDSDRRYTSQGD